MNEIPNPECDRAFFYKWGHRLSLQYEEIKQTVRNIRLKPGLEKGSYKDRNFRLQKRENLKFKPTFKRGQSINRTYFNKTFERK